VPQVMNRLSPLEVANAKVGMHADGGGLYLQVTKTVAGQLNKSWLSLLRRGPRTPDGLRVAERDQACSG
jgi:hypothetical protein